MLFSVLGSAMLYSLLASVVQAAFPPPSTGFTVLSSAFGANITISYKAISLCETTPGVRSYSGYVHLPADTTTAQSASNIFFLYFEARMNAEKAPLALWFGGGPGESSTMAAFGENGPCTVEQDSITTKLNPHSWNANVNMLYVDQPVLTGFSYDYLVNGTIDQTVDASTITTADFSRGVPATNDTFLVGTFSSQQSPISTTAEAAVVVWQFLQVWTEGFPGYNTSSTDISIWSQSYGGIYAAQFAAYIIAQNEAIANGTLKSAKRLDLTSIGIINGIIDPSTQAKDYPEYAYTSNPYGIRAISTATYRSSLAAVPACQTGILACQASLDALQPAGVSPDTANELCVNALAFCTKEIITPFSTSALNLYDIAYGVYHSAWPRYAAGYLNQAPVQAALGVPLNFTQSSTTVYNAFASTGDAIRVNNLNILADLLDRGIGITLMYGDRDYQGNWLGGQDVSLAIPYGAAKAFAKAGYADLISDDGCRAGMVRQRGNLSFARVFEAGHEVPYTQPSAAYNIFDRAISGRDIATGKQAVTADYSTTGLSSISGFRTKLPDVGLGLCYLWDVAETCDDELFDVVVSGVGIYVDFVLVGYWNGTEAVMF